MKSKKRGIDLVGKQDLSRIWSVRGLRMQHGSVVMSMRQPRGIGNERHTMNSRETCLLRTKLRQVNMEYSALVRDRMGERRFVRMGQLKTERWEIMNHLFCGGNTESPASRQCRQAVRSIQASSSTRAWDFTAGIRRINIDAECPHLKR